MDLQATKYSSEKNLLSRNPPWQVVEDVGREAIGIIDSGIGGTSVLYRLATHFSEEKFLYFADTAALPYGKKTEEEILARAQFAVDYLLSRGVRAIVIACHTLSLCSREVLCRLTVPCVAMDETAYTFVQEEVFVGPVALWGTDRTIQLGRYPGYLFRDSPGISFLTTPLSPLVEWIETQKSPPLSLPTLLSHERDRLEKMGCRTVLLLCTHFPLLLSSFEEIFDPALHFLDPAEAIVTLCAKKLHMAPKTTWSRPPVEFVVSGEKSLFETIYQKFYSSDA